MSRLEKALEKASKMRDEKKEERKAEKSVSNTEAIYTPSTEGSLKIDNPYMITVTEPDSPISEEYRKLKSLIVKLTKGDKFYNTIMVTSTLKGEGKSITALNLAITLAQEYDHSVLLVDADLRKPCVHEYLGINPKIGLTDCLVNGAEISDAFIPTGIGKLIVLPSGSKVSNPAELLSSSMMKELVKELKNQYVDRYIIFDIPPILPFAEAHSIGNIVDGVIFVVRDGYVPLSNLKEALNMLKDSNILGIVYNNMEIDQFDSYYYYNYYRSYYSDKKNKLEGTKGLSRWMGFLKGNSRADKKSEKLK